MGHRMTKAHKKNTSQVPQNKQILNFNQKLYIMKRDTVEGKNCYQPSLYFISSWVSIISRISLRRFRSNSGSLLHNLSMISFQSAKTFWVVRTIETSSHSLPSLRNIIEGLLHNLSMTSIQSAKTFWVVRPIEASSAFSSNSEELKAFNKYSNNTETISEEKEEYNWRTYFKIFVICFLDPESIMIH